MIRAMDPLDLAFAGVAEQAALIRSGEVSPTELVELYLRRIERLAPRLNAIRGRFAPPARSGGAQAAPDRFPRGVPRARARGGAAGGGPARRGRRAPAAGRAGGR